MINKNKNKLIILDAITLKNCLDEKSLLQKDSTGTTTFHWKAYYGDLQCVQSILQEGRRTNQLKEVIDAGDDKGFTPLYSASSRGHTEVVKYLLENGGNVNAETNQNSTTPGNTALINSCYKGNVDSVKLLLNYGADINHKRKDGMDCVYIAAQENKLDVLKLILPENPHLVNRHLYKGFTILHAAAKNGNYDVVKYILDQNTNSINDKQNNFDSTPLRSAIKYDGDLRMIKLLINKGADPHRVSGGKTPIEWAKETGKQEIEDYLNSL